jgi:hypothetical protein
MAGDMKESTRRIRNTVMEYINGLMVECTWVIGTGVNNMA